VREGILPDAELSAAVQNIQAVLLTEMQERKHQSSAGRRTHTMRRAHARRKRRAPPAAQRITRPIEIYPELSPVVGQIYPAERYSPPTSTKRYGYVIQSGGKRINIRADECVEV